MTAPTTPYPHAELLNCLVAMQETLLYAARKVTLCHAENVIVSLVAQVEALTNRTEGDALSIGCYQAQVDDLTAERDAALQLAADRLVDAERLTRWILQRGNSLGDHACARCRPNSEIIKKGFSCAFHLAQDLDAARQAAKDAA